MPRRCWPAVDPGTPTVMACCVTERVCLILVPAGRVEYDVLVALPVQRDDRVLRQFPPLDQVVVLGHRDAGALPRYVVDQGGPRRVLYRPAVVDALRRRPIGLRPDRRGMLDPVHQVAAGDVVPRGHPEFLAAPPGMRYRLPRQVEQVVAAPPEQCAVGIVEEPLRGNEVIARPVRILSDQLPNPAGAANQLLNVVARFVHKEYPTPCLMSAGAGLWRERRKR